MQTTYVVLAATLAVQSLAAMCLMALPSVAPVVADALEVSAAYIGAYIAIAYVGAMTASLLSGTAVQRFGAVRASQAGLAFCAAGMALSMVDSLPVVALGALFVGMGYGPITPASSHLLARSTPPDRMSFVFSIKQTGVPLGGVLAGVIVPGLTQWQGWRLAFVACAVASLLCALAVQPLCRTLDADRDPSRRLSLGSGLVGPLRMVFSHRNLAVLAIISFLFSISQLSLVSYLVTFLHVELDMGLVAAGFVLAVVQAAGVGGRLFWGYVSDRFTGSARALIGLSAISAVCALITPLLHLIGPGLTAVVVLFIFGSCAIGWNGVYLAEVARQAPPGQTSVATGGALATTFMGVVIGPPLFGAVALLSGSYGTAYATLAIPALLCLLLLWQHRADFDRAAQVDLRPIRPAGGPQGSVEPD